MVGFIAAQSLEISHIQPNETCADILQLGTSVIEESAHPTAYSISAEHRWCQHIQHLCCLAGRRQQACQKGSDHIIKHGFRNCSVNEFRTYVDHGLRAVARECCICQLIYISSTLSVKDWALVREQVKNSTCPGNGCCSLINKESWSQNKTSISVRPGHIQSDDPNTQAILSQELTSEAPQATTVGIEEEDDFTIQLLGGVDLTLDEKVFPDDENVSTSTVTDPTQSTLADPVAMEEKLTKHDTLKSVKCRDNFVWDKDQELCVKLVTSCPVGMQLNKRLGKCVVLDEKENQCASGYRFSSITEECEDINECLEGMEDGRSVCDGEDMFCENLQGSYKCNCEPGFSLADDGTCVDINECNAMRNPCPIGQQCRNIIGSYQCLREVPCGYGYVLNPKTQQCEDVDECKIDPHICGKGMLCINVRGGHKCVDKLCPGKAKRNKVGDCVPCPTGYLLNITTGICDDIDECEEPNKCRSWERCVNKAGYYICEAKLNCGYGTRINQEGTICEDINECAEKSFSCDEDQICVNTPGSYYCAKSPCTSSQIYDYREQICRCEDGYRASGDECIDIDECSENSYNCTDGKTCMNYVGGYRCVRLDECLPGYRRNKTFGRCEDIDECQSGLARCGPNMYCQNTVGSYQCICNIGYKNLNATTCVDVDECSVFRPAESCPDPRARCVNTEGSYMCVCPSGYQWTDYPSPQCQDIDECVQQPNRCGAEHRCVNFAGGYRCLCAVGYQNGVNERVCVDIDECSTHLYGVNNYFPCANSLCVNQPGGYTCQCPDGFQLGRGNQCYDIDECHEVKNICKGPKEACVNLMGTYRCVSNQCPPNYKKIRLGNGFRCEPNEHYSCISGQSCTKWVDHLFMELDMNTSVPQVLLRIDTKTLPKGVIRVNLQEHYVYHLFQNRKIVTPKLFKLVMSRTQPDHVEVLLIERLNEPMKILISVQLAVFREKSEIGHSTTRLYLFVTQSAQERLAHARRIQQMH